MSLLKMELQHAFGSTCSQGYHNSIAICEEDKNQTRVAFPIGKALARKSVDRPEMNFIHFADDVDQVQNICVLPTRSHVAVAFRPLGSPLQLIKIHSFDKKQEPMTIQVFHQTEKQGNIKLMVFSPSEPKFMCLMLGEPHNKLLFVDTFKNKALAESSFSLKQADQLTICPHNSHLICVSGGSSIKLFKVEEYTFKPLEQVRRLPKGRRITIHAWYKKKMILAATDKNELLVLEEARPNLYEIKQEYHNVFNDSLQDQMLITALCPFSKGVIMGSSNGKFCLWTKKQDGNLEGEENLELSRKWATTQQRASAVTNISIGVRQDIIAISLANNDIATLYINELIPQVSDLINDVTDKQIVFEYIYKGFHNNPITGMDICEQRPLVATCSHLDSTVRIWNYKNFGCKLLRMFYFKIKEDFESQRPLITLAFHPSGYYLAVGCVDKLRFFHVLNNELRPYRQLGVRNAQIVKFSRGGNLLAVSFPLRQQTNQHHIKIFNALTLEQVITLKDHASSIKTLQFKRYDEHLLSISQEGNLIEWRLSDWSKSKQVVKKQIRYTCCIYWHARNTIVTFGSIGPRKYLEEHNCQTNTVSQHQLDADVVAMAQIGIGTEKALILSLFNGKVITFGGLQRPVIMDSQNIHIKKASNLSLSPCGKYLMTSSQDCLVLVFKIYHEIDGIAQPEEGSNIIVDDFLADVVLINRKEIEKVNEKEKQYTKVITHLWKKLRTLMDQRLRKHKNKMVEVEVQKNRIIDDISFRVQKLNNQIEQLRQKSDGALQSLDHNNLEKAEYIERNFEQKINFEIQKYFQLEQQLIQMKMLHDQELQEIKKKEEKQIAQLKHEFQSKFKESEGIYSQSKNQSQRATAIFEDRLKQIQDQQEDQIKEIQNKKHKFKLETVAALQELFDRQAKLKKQHTRLTNQRNEEKMKNEQRIFSRRKVQKEVEEAMDKLKEMTSEYDEKIDVLKVKEKRILEFQHKISQLQKKKHILSYKGTQMKKAIEPKEMQIEKLKIDLIKLKKQFEASLERKQKSALLLQKSEKQKLNLDKLLAQQQRQTQKQINTFDKIIGDIFHCLQTYKKQGDVKIFYRQFIKLYHRYINKNEKLEQVSGSKGVDELTKQVMHLEKSLYQMTKTNEKNVLRKNDQINKRIKENTELVTNLNDIKKQNKELVLKIRSKKEEIEKLRVAKTAVLSECKNIDSNTYKLFLQDDPTDQRALQPSRVSVLRQSAKKLLPVNHKEQVNEAKRGFQKIECELVSEIEFVSQKSQKMQFYICEMKQKIKKHLIQFKCSPDSFLEEAQVNETPYSEMA